MRIRNWAALSLFAIVLVVIGAADLRAENETLNKVSRMMRSGDYDAAIGLLNDYTKENPKDGFGWISLASAYHTKGDYENAVTSNRRAAEIPYARPTACYNEACALSLLGRIGEAHKALTAAIEAGFLDFDLMEQDADLAALRAKHELEFPQEQEYTALKARNGIELAYKVLLPTGYDSAKSYPALVMFAPGSGRRSADWAITELLGSSDADGWIIVYPIAPKEGWFTHPSHHALNEMLGNIQKKHAIEGGKYHLTGFGAGARVATTYSGMSREYFQTLTTFSAWHWDRWDEDDIRTSFRDIAVRLVVGEHDAFGREMNTRAQDQMKKGGADVALLVVDADDHMLGSVRHAAVFKYVPR